MGTQPSLFDVIETAAQSASADVMVQPRKLSLKHQVLDFICNQGQFGATDEEISACLEMNPSTARPRRIELQREGKIYAAPFTRATKSGSQATVWRFTSR